MRCVLLGHRVMVWRKNPAVEQSLELLDPRVMEIIEDASIDTGPIVNWHAQRTRKRLRVSVTTHSTVADLPASQVWSRYGSRQAAIFGNQESERGGRSRGHALISSRTNAGPGGGSLSERSEST
jgi:hypothetical protein